MQIPAGARLSSGPQRISLQIRPAAAGSVRRIRTEADLRNGSDGELREQADESEADPETDEEEDLPDSEAELLLRPEDHEEDEPGLSGKPLIPSTPETPHLQGPAACDPLNLIIITFL